MQGNQLPSCKWRLTTKSWKLISPLRQSDPIQICVTAYQTVVCMRIRPQLAWLTQQRLGMRGNRKMKYSVNYSIWFPLITGSLEFLAIIPQTQSHIIMAVGHLTFCKSTRMRVLDTQVTWLLWRHIKWPQLTWQSSDVTSCDCCWRRHICDYIALMWPHMTHCWGYIYHFMWPLLYTAIHLTAAASQIISWRFCIKFLTYPNQQLA